MIPAGLQHPDLQPCRVRQGVGVVCLEAESGSLDRGRAPFSGIQPRHRGARSPHTEGPRSFYGVRNRDPLSAAPQFKCPAWKQNPLKSQSRPAV
jgi:hypothetical protein